MGANAQQFDRSLSHLIEGISTNFEGGECVVRDTPNSKYATTMVWWLT